MSLKDAFQKLREELKTMRYQYCDIYELVLKEDEENKKKVSNYQIQHVGHPCHMDWSQGIRNEFNDQPTVSEIPNRAKLYTDIEIKPASVIHVYSKKGEDRYNERYFKSSNPSSLFESHYETVVELLQEHGFIEEVQPKHGI